MSLGLKVGVRDLVLPGPTSRPKLALKAQVMSQGPPVYTDSGIWWVKNRLGKLVLKVRDGGKLKGSCDGLTRDQYSHHMLQEIRMHSSTKLSHPGWLFPTTKGACKSQAFGVLGMGVKSYFSLSPL